MMMKQMSCGNCGTKKFSVAADSDKPVDRIFVKCCGCGSGTIVAPQPVKLMLEWGADSEGVLCFLKDKENET